VGLDDWKVRYCIYKRRVDANGTLNKDRSLRQQAFAQRYRAAMSAAALGAAEYRCEDTTTPTDRRTFDREQMRASSCHCRERRTGGVGILPATGPFALLHRGRE
jgi:hypothetical protein